MPVTPSSGWLGYTANNHLVAPGGAFAQSKFCAEWPEERWGPRGHVRPNSSLFCSDLFYMVNLAGKEALVKDQWSEPMTKFWEMQIPAQVSAGLYGSRNMVGSFEPMSAEYNWGPAAVLGEFEAYRIYRSEEDEREAEIHVGALVVVNLAAIPNIQRTGYYRKTDLEYAPALILSLEGATATMAVRTGGMTDPLHTFPLPVRSIAGVLVRDPHSDTALKMTRDSYTGKFTSIKRRPFDFMTPDKQVWVRSGDTDLGDCRRCDHCQVYYQYTGETALCPQCVASYKPCSKCGDIAHQDTLTQGLNGEDICDSCRKRGAYIGLESHDWRPERFTMHAMPGEKVDTTRMYGLEFEMDTNEWNVRDKAAIILKNLMGNFPGAKTSPFFIKRDGSLIKGLEWVWHPHSVRMIENRLETIRTILTLMRREGMRSHDTKTCGFHIHVSRTSFGETVSAQNYAIERLIALTEIFQVNIVKFSRRNRSGLLRYAAPYLADAGNYGASLREVEQAIKANIGRGHDARYKGINTRNAATIEFRFFRGTLVWKTIMASLYLTENLCVLASDFSVPVEKITWDSIIALNDRDVLKDYWETRKNTLIVEHVDDEPAYDDEMPNKE